MKYSDCTTKKAQREYIRGQLKVNAAWAIKGLLKIYEHQTAEEQAVGVTIVHNGVGFSGADSDVLSSFAKQVKEGRKMSKRQMKIIFTKIPKYTNQLHKIAESKQ